MTQNGYRNQRTWEQKPENQEISTNKRLKQNESGAYTYSSNKESEDAEMSEQTRPEGQNKVKLD